LQHGHKIRIVVVGDTENVRRDAKLTSDAGE